MQFLISIFICIPNLFFYYGSVHILFCKMLKLFCLFAVPYRLAESRTNPQVLDIGLTANDLQSEDCLSPCNWDRTELSPADGDELFMF